jgi:hypothetical protein
MWCSAVWWNVINVSKILAASIFSVEELPTSAVQPITYSMGTSISFPIVQQLEYEANPSSLISTKAKNMWSFTSATYIHGMMFNHRDIFTFIQCLNNKEFPVIHSDRCS